MTPSPPTLADAITGVENAQSAYNTALTQTNNDQLAAAAIQTKLDAATLQVATDQKAQGDAANSFNSALDALIAAATGAKIGAVITTSTPSTGGN